jgi:hypothetical protein
LIIHTASVSTSIRETCKLGTGGSLLYYLLRRLRSGGLQFEASLGKIGTHLQNNQSKMDQRCDSSHRVPAL